MALGIHSFYVFPRTHNLIEQREKYFIGSFMGDHYNDEQFKERLNKIHSKIKEKYGNGFTYFWSPGIVKPYQPLTTAQKYKRSVTKASNIHKKNALKIIQQNTLFTDDYLYEEINRHHARIDVLRKRYKHDQNK